VIPLNYTRWLYYTGLLGIIAGMSLSKPAVSTGLIVCSVAWLSETDYVNRIKSLKNQPFFWISLAFVLMHVLGLLWSENLQYGIKDIKTKLPLIVLPFIFGSSKAFDLRSAWKYINFVFIGSLIACSLLSFAIYFHWIKPAQFTETDMRTMLFGVSGVRLALFICLAICFLVSDMYKIKNSAARLIYIGIIGWFLFFLNFIESGTAIVFLLVLSLFTVVYFIWRKFNVKWRIILLSVITVAFFAGAYAVYNTVSGLFVLKEEPVKSEKSTYGEKYYFDKSLNYIENGYMVGKYIAWVELELAWQERSKIPFKGRDKLHQSIYATIIRYLNSKGGVKDKEALDKLTDTDIRNIENGIANASYLEMYGWQRRLLQIVYEFVSYKADKSNPFGNSVTQRFEYWGIGWDLFCQHPIAGIGTGDVGDAYDAVYRNYKFEIEHRHKLRAHNQYLTIAITLGIIGLIIFLVYALSMLWIKGYTKHSYAAFSFLIIMLLSFISEDTLETQSGLTFIAFFQVFFNLRCVEGKLS
jgi:hypothetical protein